MLTTPALLRLLLTTAAQSRDCARPGLGRFDRSHIVEVGADARTRSDFLHPKFLEKIQRLVVLTERRIKVLVFGRILFPVRMWDQQPFREKPVLQGVPCHCSLSDLCSGAGGLRGISAIGFDFSRRGRRFFVYSCGCCCWSLGFLACHSVLVISRGIVRNDGRLRSLWLFD